METKKQQLNQKIDSELKFRPQITKYDKPPTVPKIKRSQTELFDFKPKISKNSEQIINQLTREKDCS